MQCKRIYFALLMCAYFFHAFSYAGSEKREELITIAVASNVQYVFKDIQAAYKQSTGRDVRVIYGSSGKLVAQIMHGSPYDLFLSADMSYPHHLFQHGYATSLPKAYVKGELVLWSMKKRDLSQWQKAIIANEHSKIALANPKTAPYGIEALNVLNYYQLTEKLKNRLVFGESLAQTNQFIHSGAAEFGFTAKSVVISNELAGQGSWISLPIESYKAIEQGAVILQRGKNKPAAQSFYQFLYSNQALAIFIEKGYRAP